MQEMMNEMQEPQTEAQEPQGLAAQGVQAGGADTEQIINQIIELLKQGVTPDELVQQGVPKELVQEAVARIGGGLHLSQGHGQGLAAQGRYNGL